MRRYSWTLTYACCAQVGAIVFTMIGDWLHPPKEHDYLWMLQIGLAGLFFTGALICAAIEQLTEKINNAPDPHLAYRRNSVLGMD